MNTKINNWFIDPESILNPKLHDKQNIDSSVLSYIDYLNEYIDFITDSELNRRLNYLYKYFMGYVNFTFTYENIFDKCNDSFGEQYGGSSTKYMILIDNKITTLGKLSTKTKTELKDIQLNAREIKDIEIKLELNGLMLNGSL